MEKEDYKFRISCDLIVTSESVSIEEITDKLGILPQRFYRKGEVFCSKSSGTVGKRLYNLWAFKVKEILDEPIISGVVEKLHDVFRGKEAVLLGMKNDSAFGTSVYIWIETDDDAHFGLDMIESDISFFSLVNHVHLTYIPDKEIIG